MSHDDPRRLGDDPATAPELRRALREAGSAAAPPDLVAQLLRNASPPPPPSPWALSRAALLKALVPLSLLGLAGLSSLALRPRPASPPADVAAASPPSAPPSAALDPPALDPEPPPAASVAALAGPSLAPSARPAPSARRPDEAALLEQARASLASNPTRALALTREHQRLFPAGLLAQEREVLAVEALRRLGKRDEARARGEQFRSDNPDSPYERHVRP